MLAYKLLKKRKDGSLGPLFINASQKIPMWKWLDAEDHPTKGFAHRPGWHCTREQNAPHIKKNPKAGLPRVWCRVEVDGAITEFLRPKLQGGMWFIAERMRVIEVLG